MGLDAMALRLRSLLSVSHAFPLGQPDVPVMKNLSILCLFLFLAGCATPPPPPPSPSAFDQSLMKAASEIRSVTRQLAENQNNPSLYNGFPLPGSRSLLPPSRNSAGKPLAQSNQENQNGFIELRRSDGVSQDGYVLVRPSLPASSDPPVTVQVKDIPVGVLFDLISKKIGWTYAHNGDTRSVLVSIEATDEPLSLFCQNVEKLLSNRVSIHLDQDSKMILLSVR